MRKLLFLAWGDPHRPLGEFATRMRTEVAPELIRQGALRLKLSVTEDEPPRLSLLPLMRVPLALFSLWVDDDASDSAFTAALEHAVLRVAGYRVTESIPLSYTRDWRDGAVSPGAVLLSLFRQKPGIARSRFLEIWHGEHTPMALRIHPLWSYTRNLVEAKVVASSPEFDGVVEEHFRSLDDVLRPSRLFGGRLRMLKNMIEVGLHVRSFLSLGSVENYILREYHLRS